MRKRERERERERKREREEVFVTDTTICYSLYGELG